MALVLYFIFQKANLRSLLLHKYYKKILQLLYENLKIHSNLPEKTGIINRTLIILLRKITKTIIFLSASDF